MARAMVLAAGLGTRLRPLSDELPKPLVPVGDAPALAHVLRCLARAGFDEAVVNVHHRPEAFDESVRDALPLRIAVVHEPTLLGTGGGVANARRLGLLASGTVVVWNGDILADVDVGPLVDRVRGRVAGAMAVAPRLRGEGTVGVDRDGFVVRLRGRMFGDEARGGDFLGIQAIGEELAARLPAQGCLVGDGYLPALDRGEQIAAIDAAGPWDDLGTVAAYLAANARWLARRGVPSFTGPGVRVAASVELVGTVIGARAAVEGAGQLQRCVVWPGARAVAPLSDAVVTTAGAIVRASG